MQIRELQVIFDQFCQGADIRGNIEQKIKQVSSNGLFNLDEYIRNLGLQFKGNFVGACSGTRFLQALTDQRVADQISQVARQRIIPRQEERAASPVRQSESEDELMQRVIEMSLQGRPDTSSDRAVASALNDLLNN